MILSFLSSSVEQGHYLHLVYLVLLPPHIYYFSPTSQCEITQSVFEVKITIFETKPVNSQPKCLPILFILFPSSLKI